MITNKQHELALENERINTYHERMRREREVDSLIKKLTAAQENANRAIKAGEELRKQVDRAEAEKASAVAQRDAMEARYRALTLADGNVTQAKKVHAWLTEPEPTPEPETVEVDFLGTKVTVEREKWEAYVAGPRTTPNMALLNSLYGKGFTIPFPRN